MVCKLRCFFSLATPGDSGGYYRGSRGGGPRKDKSTLWVYLPISVETAERTAIGSAHDALVVKIAVPVTMLQSWLALNPGLVSLQSDAPRPALSRGRGVKRKKGKKWSPSQRAKFQRTVAMKQREVQNP